MRMTKRPTFSVNSDTNDLLPVAQCIAECSSLSTALMSAPCWIRNLTMSLFPAMTAWSQGHNNFIFLRHSQSGKMNETLQSSLTFSSKVMTFCKFYFVWFKPFGVSVGIQTFAIGILSKRFYHCATHIGLCNFLWLKRVGGENTLAYFVLSRNGGKRFYGIDTRWSGV